MLDPAIHLLIASLFAVLFITAGWHKLSKRQEFLSVMQNYQILPTALVPLAATMLAVVELGLGLAWAFAWGTVAVAASSAALLGLYALAMGLNLARGRDYIDCGCSFASIPGSMDAAGQAIGPGLIARNGVLLALALLGVIPQGTRSLAWMDYCGVVLAASACVLLYAAFNQLVANRSAINSWRKPHAGESSA